MKRFVSYLYSIYNNQKIHNAGFARIELRTGRNRVDIHLKENGYAGKTGTVYLFVRKKENIQGISIGNITFRNNQADFRYEQAEENIGQTPWQIMQMGGILIMVDDRAAFLSQWDEQPVDTARFEIWNMDKLNDEAPDPTLPGIGEASSDQDIGKKEGIGRETGNIQQDGVATQSEFAPDPAVRVETEGGYPVAGKQGIGSACPVGNPAAKGVEVSAGNPVAVTSEEAFAGNPVATSEEASAGSSVVTSKDAFAGKPGKEGVGASNSKSAARGVEAFAGKPAAKGVEASVGNPVAKGVEASVGNPVAGRASAFEGINASTREEAESTSGSERLSDIQTAELQPQPKTQWDQTWRHMLRTYPALNQFTDKNNVLCVRIEIKDVRQLPEKYWSMVNNSFLLHGFFNYRHLAFGRIDQNWFIGVPGIYQNQEHVMASMFGFPDFLPQKQKNERGGQPGYWYRVLEI